MPPSFGISCFRAGNGLIGALDQFVPDLPEESLYALRLDGREGDPVYSGSTIIIFGQRIRFA